ncbi:MAG: hypothetical protein ABIG95_04980 [Candidatus Woesearchaeota archaeon]
MSEQLADRILVLAEQQPSRFQISEIASSGLGRTLQFDAYRPWAFEVGPQYAVVGYYQGQVPMVSVIDHISMGECKSVPLEKVVNHKQASRFVMRAIQGELAMLRRLDGEHLNVSVFSLPDLKECRTSEVSVKRIVSASGSKIYCQLVPYKDLWSNPFCIMNYPELTVLGSASGFLLPEPIYGYSTPKLCARAWENVGTGNVLEPGTGILVDLETRTSGKTAISKVEGFIPTGVSELPVVAYGDQAYILLHRVLDPNKHSLDLMVVQPGQIAVHCKSLYSNSPMPVKYDLLDASAHTLLTRRLEVIHILSTDDFTDLLEPIPGTYAKIVPSLA